MLRTDSNTRFSAQRACLAMRNAISDIPLESLQKQIDKPLEPPERREEIEAALNEFAQDINHACNNTEELLPIESSVGEEYVVAGDALIGKGRRSISSLVVVRITACLHSMNGLLMVYTLTRM
jgi:hypothetical protein